MENENLKCAEYSFANKRKNIIIEVCDLFEQEGLKVVHCHNTFDTSDDVMNPRSVMGQFIERCKQANVDLDKCIEDWCKKHDLSSRINDALPCRQQVFTLGEVCPVNLNGKKFVLAAFEDLEMFLNSGSMDINEYMFFLDNLWHSIARSRVDKGVINVPCFGNKIVNIRNFSFSVEQKIALIALSFFKSVKSFGTINTLKICVYKGDVVDVDISEWYKKLNVWLQFLYEFSKLPLGMKEIFHPGTYVGMPFDVVPIAARKDKNQKLRVFISHSSKDVEIANEIYNKLKENDFDCWMDVYDIRPGRRYAGEIIRGFTSCDVIVLILSKNSMQSDGVLNEIDIVYKKGKNIIPFRTDNTELNDEFLFYLANKQWINAFDNHEDHINDLINVLNSYKESKVE